MTKHFLARVRATFRRCGFARNPMPVVLVVHNMMMSFSCPWYESGNIVNEQKLQTLRWHLILRRAYYLYLWYWLGSCVLIDHLNFCSKEKFEIVDERTKNLNWKQKKLFQRTPNGFEFQFFVLHMVWWCHMSTCRAWHVLSSLSTLYKWIPLRPHC